jgi:endonuclease YncB( thermonuclease family)
VTFRKSVRAVLVVGLLVLAAARADADRVENPAYRCEHTRAHHDGDTFVCEVGSGTDIVVRVASIDAPETGQANWRAARMRLRDLTGGGAMLDCYKTDRYARHVCHVKTKDGTDVAMSMLQEGHGWYPERYAGEDTFEEREAYRRAQSEAQ